MLKLLSILWNSFRMALQELKVNKLRTFLSLFGITIGIFCIIGVLATVSSLNKKLQDDVNTLGTNTIYIDKWQYGGGPDYPWWKFVNRPIPKMDEVKFIKEKSTLAKNVCYFLSNNTNASYKNSQLTNVSIFGVTDQFDHIQTLDMAYGRYFSDAEMNRGSLIAVIGYSNAESLFGKAEYALGKEVTLNGKKVTITGVLAKQGNIINIYDYDNCFIIPYKFFVSMYEALYSDRNFIMVQGKDGVPTKAMIDELEGLMRQVRRISPAQEDNFALNDVGIFTSQLDNLFATANIGGWAIAGLSLIVGAFGVANIMFVTVRERTSQIGLKKAIGAKSRTILTEFLLESAFLCILGGLFGLLLVWGLASLLSTVMPFPIVIAPNIIILAFSICIILGILSGIIPASIAARMNPVVAIRSK